MENIEKREERRPKETEALTPIPVTRMKEIPTRVAIEATHPPRDVAQRLRENLAPPEKTQIGSHTSVRLGQEADIAGNADKFRNVDAAGNFRKAVQKATG